MIACHVHPDGDALGSLLALGHFLGRWGHKVWLTWGSEETKIPPQYAFLPGTDRISAPGEVPERPAIFVSVDCADRSRLDLLEPVFEHAGTRINLDHHLSNDGFGDVNLVDPDAPASAGLVHALIRRLGGTPDLEEATCLYTGLVTDTGRFQYSNASPATLRLAADLRELGIDHTRVAVEVYESASFAYLLVLGTVLSRARLDGELVWTWLDQADLDGLSLDETEQFIDVLRSVRESEVAMLAKEQPEGGYKVSLRSRTRIDVAEIAASFGGGGHARAAGYSAPGPVEELVGALRARLP
ncbi:MAG: DHH family phosphoesterase [Actinomycetota bacterium]